MMGFLTKLFGGKQEIEEAALAMPAMTFPTTVEVVPEQLSVRVFSHSVENVPGAFWSFVTVGLKAHGQREIVLTLLRRKNEPESALPGAVFAFFVSTRPTTSCLLVDDVVNHPMRLNERRSITEISQHGSARRSARFGARVLHSGSKAQVLESAKFAFGGLIDS